MPPPPWVCPRPECERAFATEKLLDEHIDRHIAEDGIELPSYERDES